MRKEKTKTITVNELNNILEREFGFRKVFIEKAEISSINKQFGKTRVEEIGTGGVLNITFSYDEK